MSNQNPDTEGNNIPTPEAARQAAEESGSRAAPCSASEIERLLGIILACHRAFIGGSPFVQREARRMAAAEIEEMDRRAKGNSKQNA